jgi:ribonuclease VapC
MIVDASALVAILGREREAERLLARLCAAPLRSTHPISLYETVLALRRINDVSSVTALADVQDFLEAVNVQIVSIDASIACAALDASDRYGKGRHPAALNMGDCFSYACARLRGMPLLYKGDDFARTDITAA